MRKPSKKPKKVQSRSHVMSPYSTYTPEELEEVAKEMRDEGILAVCFDILCEYGETYPVVYEKRMETEHEASVRYEKEVKAYEEFLDFTKEREQRIIEEARKLGMEFKEQQKKNGAS